MGTFALRQKTVLLGAWHPRCSDALYVLCHCYRLVGTAECPSFRRGTVLTFVRALCRT